MAQAGIYKWHIDIQAGNLYLYRLARTSYYFRINTSVSCVYSNILIII